MHRVLLRYRVLHSVHVAWHGEDLGTQPSVQPVEPLLLGIIISCTLVGHIDMLPLPVTIKSHSKSSLMGNGIHAVQVFLIAGQ